MIRPQLWDDKLSSLQEDLVGHVYSAGRYDQIHRSLLQGLSSLPVISIDSEHALHPGQGKTPENFVQVAFGHSCRLVIFHMHPLRQGHLWLGVEGALSESVMDTLPPLFCMEVLCCENIFKLVLGGSQEEGTFSHLLTVVDVQEVYCHMIPPVDVCPSAHTKHGLAVIGMVANGYAHKPNIAKTPQASLSLFAEWTGKELYLDQGWPRWRNYEHLYTWTCGQALNSWHMAQDVWSPLAFLFILLKCDIFNSSPGVSEGLANASSRILSHFIYLKGSAVTSRATLAATPHTGSAVTPCAALAVTPHAASAATPSTASAVAPHTAAAAAFQDVSAGTPSTTSVHQIYRVGSPHGPRVSLPINEADPDIVDLNISEEDLLDLDEDPSEDGSVPKRHRCNWQ